jgi:hypothetical protein
MTIKLKMLLGAKFSVAEDFLLVAAAMGLVSEAPPEVVAVLRVPEEMDVWFSNRI